MYPKLPNVELSGGRSGEDVAHGSAHRGPAGGQWLGWVVGYFTASGRKLAPPAASVTLPASPKRGHARFQKEEKNDSRPQPEARTRSSKSPRNFFHHTTTLLLGLSIRKTTEFMPKSPVFLLRDVIRRTVTLKFETNSSPGRQKIKGASQGILSDYTPTPFLSREPRRQSP
jgi:hypothetical protein